MRKKIVVFILCLTQSLYSVTHINFTRQLVVIYKVLSPLSVVVDKPEKMVVKKGKDTFKYSSVIRSQAPLNVRIEAPYNFRDEILDRIYGTATLTLKNQGKFDLKKIDDYSKTIDGRGFFPTEGEQSYKMVLPLNDVSAANKYQASTKIDAIFNENKVEMLMGNYKGVLILDVTYGG